MTFPATKFSEYGYCLRGFIENWPSDVIGYALVEGAATLNIDTPKNLNLLEYNEFVSDELKAFEDRNVDKEINDFSTIGDIDSQAAKFARKVFAQLYALKNIECDYLHYIDADLYTYRSLDTSIIERLFEGEYLVACLPRWAQNNVKIENIITENALHVGYTETGYIVWNKSHKDLGKWITLYESCYTSDKIFDFRAWHDCIAFDYATLTCIIDHKSEIKQLSDSQKTNHPLVLGPLGAYFDHMKGNRKINGASMERLLAHGSAAQKIYAAIRILTSKILFRINKSFH